MLDQGTGPADGMDHHGRRRLVPGRPTACSPRGRNASWSPRRTRRAIDGSANNLPSWPGQLQQAAFALISRGAAMIEYWHWHTIPYGAETYWGGVLPHSLQPGRVYQGSVRHRCRAREDRRRSGRFRARR